MKVKNKVQILCLHVAFVLACTATMTIVPMGGGFCCSWCSFERIGSQIDRAIDSVFTRQDGASKVVVHDIVEHENVFKLAITLPNIDHNSLQVELEGDQLNVSATLEQENHKERLELSLYDKELSYCVDVERSQSHGQQVYSGSSVQTLPDSIDLDGVKASIEGDTLQLVLPKKHVRKKVMILKKDRKVEECVCQKKHENESVSKLAKKDHESFDLDLK